MARIPLALQDRTKRPSFLTRRALEYARKAYGGDVDSALAMSHHEGVFWPWTLMEAAGQRRHSQLPENVGSLVEFVTAVHLGCSWCVDFAASLWEKKGLDPAVLREAAQWRSSDIFDADTRAAFAYAEAVSGDMTAVEDDMVADLRERFADAGLVELTYLVVLENMRSRFNKSLGLSSQGFSSDACAIPLTAGAQPPASQQS